MHDCTLTVLAGTRDISFLPLTYAHLTRTLGYGVKECILVLDTLPPARQDDIDRLIGTAKTVTQGDSRTTVVPLHTVSQQLPTWAEHHFGGAIPRTRDYRGVPLFGWIAGLQLASTEYVLHCDSDILLYRHSSYDWVGAAISLLKAQESAMFIAPRPGPPRQDRQLLGQSVPPEVDNEGNFRFRTFSSRRFLCSRKKMAALLPCKPVYRSLARRLLMHCGGPSAIAPWETCVGTALEHSERWVRLHTSDSRCWSIHSPEHTDAWVSLLPRIIGSVEEGVFPPEQAGQYDLAMPAWRDSLERRVHECSTQIDRT